MVDNRFFKNNGPMRLQQVAEICGAKLKDEAKANIEISNINSMYDAGDGDVCFFYDKKQKEKAKDIKATACVTSEDLASLIPEGVAVIVANSPKHAFLNLNLRFYSEIKPSVIISPSAKIASTAIIGENCFIGDNVVIEDNVKIGNNCIIEHNAVVSYGCELGNDCRIGVGAHVSYCIMGHSCYIYSGARVGLDGFGFLMVGGQHKRIPQIGKVIIGNDVEVGVNACIDRGALDDTVIGDGCRIDNLVQVAHGVKLGRGCVLVSQVGIAGSCEFGDYVVCGGQAGFADHLKVGSGAQVGAQSGIMRDIDPGTILMGYPAVPIKDFMRQVSFVQKSSKKGK